MPPTSATIRLDQDPTNVHRGDTVTATITGDPPKNGFFTAYVDCFQNGVKVFTAGGWANGAPVTRFALQSQAWVSGGAEAKLSLRSAQAGNPGKEKPEDEFDFTVLA